MTVLINLVGAQFGRLSVMERAPNGKRRNARWVCMCSCGNETIVRSDSLRSGRTQSCGCLSVETATNFHTKHGEINCRIYTIWQGMRQRCQNEMRPEFHNYGGRGITVCDEWQDYEPFAAWAKANGYADNLSIDRIDVDGNYEPSNCRWATAKEQANNKRKPKK